MSALAQPDVSCVCATESDTDAAAAALAARLQPGDVIVLTGDLGAGKTRFVQGVARALGIDQEVTSPTFAIHVVYAGGALELNHFDLYWLESELDLEDIGYWEILEGDGASFVEWGDKFPDALPVDYALLDIQVDDGGNRVMRVEACGPRSMHLAESLG